MRVIAGSAKGLRLVAPEGLEVRPTLDRVRESLFNILAPCIEDAAFLDLFSGTGAIGIEALSRGARRAVLVENNREALAAMARNLATTRLQDRADCRRLNLPEGLGRLSGKFDIVFIDPPYSFDRHEELLGGLQSLGLLTPEAEVIVEYRTHSALAEHVGNLHQHRVRRYGQTSLAFYGFGSD